MRLKYSFTRNYYLSILLIHISEVSILSVLIVSAFAPFYQQVFETINFSSPFHNSFTIAMLALNCLVLLLTIAPNWPHFYFLKPMWVFAGIVLKLFPYLLSTPLLTYSLGSAQ